MIAVSFSKVKPHEVERLRSWMAELTRRADEVRETFRQEGTRHEKAYLLPGADGPILVYVMEVDDFDSAAKAFRESSLPIDLEHRRIMERVDAGHPEVEELYDLALA